jgi:hypothetical protein
MPATNFHTATKGQKIHGVEVELLIYGHSIEFELRVAFCPVDWALSRYDRP